LPMALAEAAIDVLARPHCEDRASTNTKTVPALAPGPSMTSSSPNHQVAPTVAGRPRASEPTCGSA
jgi:hypothetical protein